MNNKNNFLRLILIIGFINMVCSCKKSEKKNQSEMPFFDIKGYFKKEAVRLMSKKPFARKSLTRENGTKDITESNSVNWNDDLELFIRSDINKPAWFQSYKISHSKNNDTMIQQYKALDDKLAVRDIQIATIGSYVQSIKIKKYAKNSLYELIEIMDYFPDKGYNIKIRQKMIILPETSFNIKADLIIN